MATAAKFRIDVAIHDLLVNSSQRPPAPAQAKGLTLPEPVFPQFPERLNNPGPETPPEKRKWGAKDVYRYSRGWLGPYVRSRVLPGEFHPITAYLFVEYKCNLDCWYCWSYNNKVKGMTEDMKMSEAIEKIRLPDGYGVKQYKGTTMPARTDRFSIKWDGEWHITVEVFRDLGLAFAAVLVLIYVLVVGWFWSFITPLVIMAPIPLTLVGILPAHALMGAFFTATSMIGFIAGAGIIV